MSRPRTIAALVNSNILPSSVELLTFHNRVHGLTSRIDKLLLEVQKLEDKRTTYLAVLSAVRRIPLDVLGEIFALLIPRDLTVHDRAALLRLGQVCRSWRAAMFQERSVWSGLVLRACVCFRLGKLRLERAHGTEYDSIIQWYGRAGGYRKRLTYTASERCPCHIGKRCEATHPTVVRLLRQGPELHHFTLQLAGLNCLRQWLQCMDPSPTSESSGAPSSPSSAVADPWRSLRSLSLLFSRRLHPTSQHSDVPTTSYFAQFPKVTTFRLDLPEGDSYGETVGSLVQRLHIAPDFLGRLTSFTLKWDWGIRLLDTLTHCVALDSFTLDLGTNRFLVNTDSIDNIDKWRATPLSLPFLREFRLRQGGGDILEYLAMPLLRTLDLELVDAQNHSDTACVDISRFLKRCELTTTLQNLRICGITGLDGTAFIHLPILSALKSLELDSSKVHSYHFDIDDWDGTPNRDRQLFPVMTEFRLLNLRRSILSLSPEISYLLERARAEHCTVTVSYTDGPYPSESSLQRLVPSDRSPSITVRVIGSKFTDTVKAIGKI
ncbi:hypothetical protein D9611_006610 [Ephemerocybe angulata]|uniref:F-box domain-containing protein n=1 Tax=Ephemerocybe angulata TaxID=980116 RepID=A0A8H5FH55_9AGAR|nr:hypothetical protein D9611_006610 [Tulosesus angulatus]